MITLDLSILNQKGTPMFNSDLFANRPAAGIVGRIFISTDTQTIFRDTGTTWDTIGGGGGTIAGSIADGQVAFGTALNTIGGVNTLFWDNATNRLGIGTNSPGDRISVLGNTNSGQLVRIQNQSAGNGAVSGLNLLSDTQTGGIYLASSGYTTSGVIGANTVFLYGAGSTNLAIAVNSSGYFAIGTGSVTPTERLRLTNSGFLGIGTTNPSSILDVSSNGGKLTITQNTSANVTNGINMRGSSGTSISQYYFNEQSGEVATTTANGYWYNIVVGGVNAFKINEASKNVGINFTGDAGFKLDVGGTGRYQDNLTISKNQNAATELIITNTTAGTSAGTQFRISSNLTSGLSSFGKFSSLNTPVKIITASNAYWYNDTAGDMALLNDFASGTIKFAAGASSTAQMTLFANGNLGIGSTTQIATTIKLQVTGTAYISDTSAYSTGTIQSFVTVRNTTINTAISASSGICNYVSTGDSTIQSSQSVPASTSFAGIYGFNKYAFASAGLTLTATQAAGNGLRSISQLQTQNVFKGTNSGTITHVSGIQIAGFYNENTGSITPVIPNAYQLLINDTGAYGHTFSFTNRWGIYQEGINDRNYLAGNLLLNSTTDTGQILQINGAIRVNGQASGTAGGASGNHLIINVDGTQYKIALLNP